MKIGKYSYLSVLAEHRWMRRKNNSGRWCEGCLLRRFSHFKNILMKIHNYKDALKVYFLLLSFPLSPYLCLSPSLSLEITTVL